MGKIKTCAIVFKNRKEVYRDGELVSGFMMLDVLEPVAVKGVRVYCYGEALTKWSKEFSRDWNSDQVGQEKYYASVVTVFGRKVNEEGPSPTLTAGKHRWPFAFRLPADRLPSSFEGEHGAIRWFLKAEVDKPFPSVNNRWFRPFTVLSCLDTNEPVFQPPQSKTVSKSVSKALGLGKAGTLRLSLKTDHFGYCCGEKIIFKVEAANESSKDMGKVSASLVQKVVFKANDETRTTEFCFFPMESQIPLAKGTSMTLTDLQLTVPAVPPSTRTRTCQIITCTYHVKATVHVPWGLNLDALVPIAIGTIPRGKRVPPPRQTAAQCSDPSTAIHYVACQTGIVPCRKSHNNFPNFPFTPATAYVSDDVSGLVPPANLAAATPSSVTALPAAGIAMPGAIPVMKQAEASSYPAGSSAMMVAVPATVPPPYTTSSAAQEELGPPPSYEDVLKMDDEFPQKELVQSSLPAASPSLSSSSPSSSASSFASPGASTPKGKACSVLLVRFPDAQLGPFREAIRREQNNLLDAEEAYLAALSPQPITGLEQPNEEWPERSAIAVLVFPDMRSGEDWFCGVRDRGDAWCVSCDALIVPAEWPLAHDNERLVFSMATVRTRAESSQQLLQEFSRVASLLTKIRQENGGVRVVLSKKGRMLQGRWASSDDTVALIHWPKVNNYFSYTDTMRKGEFAGHVKQFRSLFKSHALLLISEDVTSLSTQPTVDDADDPEGGSSSSSSPDARKEGGNRSSRAGEVDEGEEEGLVLEDDEDDLDDGGRAENLLVAEEHFS